MENVPELLAQPSTRSSSGAPRRSSDYRVEGDTLNAADYGVPQRRRRAIVIGARSGPVPWPAPTHGDPRDPDPRAPQPWVTFREAVEGLPLTPDGKRLAPAAQPAAGERPPLQGGAAGRRRPLRDAAKPRPCGARRPRAEVLAQEADRDDRRLRAAVVGPPRLHDPDRVLQAGEGPLPPPVGSPPDHRARGGPLHELPGRLRPAGAPDDDQRRQDRSGTPFRRCWPAPSPSAWWSTWIWAPGTRPRTPGPSRSERSPKPAQTERVGIRSARSRGARARRALRPPRSAAGCRPDRRPRGALPAPRGRRRRPRPSHARGRRSSWVGARR